MQGARRNSGSVKKDAAAEVRLLGCSKIVAPEDCMKRDEIIFGNSFRHWKRKSLDCAKAARAKKKTPDAKKGRDLGQLRKLPSGNLT